MAQRVTSCQNLRSQTMTVLSRPALANSWSLPSLHSTDFTLLRRHSYSEKEPAASKPCVATKSSEGLVPILLEIPRSQGLVPRGSDQPVSIPGGPAEGKDGVVMAVAASKRQLGLHLAGVLHVEVAIFIGEAQKLLEPWHWAEVHGVGGWFRIHLGAVHVRRYRGVVIVLGADEGGDESFVGESSGRRLKPAKLPGC